MGMTLEDELLNRAKAGDAEAYAHLAEGNLHGQFTGTPDYEKAYWYAKQAADGGAARAFTVLGILCLEGRGGTAEDNAVNVCGGLSDARITGMDCGVPEDNAVKACGGTPDYTTAEKYLRHADELQDMKAPRFLGQMCAEGLGCAANWAAARAWYETGAARGDISSMYMLGRIYEKGLGIKPDLAQAIEWYRRSAVRADHIGQPSRDALKRLGAEPET